MRKGDEKLNSIYKYIQQFADDNGFPPSVREIAAQFNIKSTSTVHYYLEKMKASGLIEHAENKKRAVVVNNKRSQANFVPLVGNVSAGQGILAMQNIEDEVALPNTLFGGNDLYLLRVEGDSMINAGISNGDLVVVHQQNEVELGEIAVVLWQEKATIKRLKQTAPQLVLHPENDAMEDIVISPDECPVIIGKVVGCIKKF